MKVPDGYRQEKYGNPERKNLRPFALYLNRGIVRIGRTALIGVASCENASHNQGKQSDNDTLLHVSVFYNEHTYFSRIQQSLYVTESS